MEVKEGARVIDVACGAGIIGRLDAERLGKSGAGAKAPLCKLDGLSGYNDGIIEHFRAWVGGYRKPEEDPYRLSRFVDAQDRVCDLVYAELAQGRKRTHWMWFIFPQLKGLGSSLLSQEFAITSLEEAKAYLQHPILGPRLLNCSRLVHQTEGRTIKQILGSPDDLKFKSSMTLFAHATTDNKVFLDPLEKYFGGRFDPQSLEILGV